MANSLYDIGRNGFLNGDIDFLNDTIKMALVKDSYSPDLSMDEYYSDVSSNIISTPQALSGKTTSAGVANCSDVTFTAVPAGAPTPNTIGYILIFKYTGNDATSPLIALYDTASGLPIITSNADITIKIDTGVNKLFKL
jgi:hypothetical protein